MNRKFIHDISASTIQVILNQVLGLAIFLVSSRFLSKAEFGEFNWSLAVLTFITTLLSLRLEQLIVRRIAAGENAGRLLTLFAGHVFFSGLLFYGVLLTGSFLFPSFFREHDLLLLLAISQLAGFFAFPFKQLAHGKENFRVLAIMSSIANLVRVGGLLIILFFFELNVRLLIFLYIISSVAELLVCYVLATYRLRVTLSAQYGLKEYFSLIKESLPQAGVVFLNASIARIDWILLGLLSTSFITAEYSFAYRVYELSPLPLLILAPILLSRFSRFFSSGTEKELLARREDISRLIRFEMIAATGIPLVLNMIWAPVMGALTLDKYGETNREVFLVLSCCIPFLYLNNLLWTVHFAQNKLRLILRITLITFLIILAGDLVFIPRFAARGAAFVYLLAIIVEYFLYMRTSFLASIRETWLSPLLTMVLAGGCGVLAYRFTESAGGRLLVSLPLFCLLLLATKQLRSSDIRYVVRFFGRQPH